LINTINIYRIYTDSKTTLGLLKYKDLSLFTLELPWLDNKQNISCIPKGIYNITIHDSLKFKKCIKIWDVPNRTDILMHVGNSHRNSTGCILVGDSCNWQSCKKYKIINSKIALNRLINKLDFGADKQIVLNIF